MATNAEPDGGMVDASSESHAGPQGPEQAPPRRRRRRWRWWIGPPVVVLLVLIVLVALAPFLASTATGSRLILSLVNDQIRGRVGVQKLPTAAPGTVTISAGAAEFDANYDFEATLRMADRRMYEAKAAGRNCVV